MQRSFCLRICKRCTVLMTVHTFIIYAQRGVFVSLFILLMVFGDTSYTMSTTSPCAFLVLVGYCIDAEFGGLVSSSFVAHV